MSARAALPHPRLLIATTILASSLAFIDGSVVNVGLPSLARSFETTGGDLSWVINGYTLPLSALLLIGGAAGDVFGVRRLLVAGLLLFALASLGCAMAPSLTVLIACRVAQGAASALLMPNSLAILGVYFDDEVRGRAVGTWAGAGAGAAAIGPILGGYLIDVTGWRAIFLINLPVATGAVALAFRSIPEDPPADARYLDWPGAVLVGLALTALTWGLTVVSLDHGGERTSALSLVAGVLALVAFVRFEQSKSTQAMLPISLFHSLRFVALTVFTLFLYGALSAIMMLVPFILIEQSRYSATAAGAALLPLPIAIALGSSWAGHLAAKIGARKPLTIGALLAATGCALSLRVPSVDSYWLATFPGLLMLSIGMAIVVAPLTTAVLDAVADKHNGVASGFNSAVARIGGLIAVAFCSAVLARRGHSLTSAFRAATLISALACGLAALCAYIGLRPIPQKYPRAPVAEE